MAVPIQRVMHVNLNCSDLERSLRFFRELAGLEPLVHTNPLPQDGAGLGLQGRVQWDARILHDRRGFEGPALDLLQWRRPGPVGTPYPEANHLGMSRLCLLVPDLDAVYARARAAGSPCLSAPVVVPVDPERGLEVRGFLCHDPDGVTLEFVEQPGDPRLTHVNVNCSDLDRSCRWYQRVLGLEVRGGSRAGPAPGEAFGLPGLVEWDARFLWPPDQDAFAIDLVEWKRPSPVGAPYPCANHLGLYRMAFLVEDIRFCHQELRRLGVACGEPAWLDMGPEVPIDGLWALVFPDPDGTCLELIEAPVVATGA